MLGSLAFAQGNFSGPGILSSGSGSVGQRSGQDVDLRYFVNASGIHDTGFTPYAVTKEGTLLRPGALAGVEAGLGGYGRHSFRRSVLGLDYSGSFRHYPGSSKYDGSNQSLALSYMIQKSPRLSFSMNQAAGTQNYGTAFGTNTGPVGTQDVVVDSNSLLFDNRTSFVQSSMTSQYAISGRTSISMGGSYYSIHRQSSALVGVNGYSLHGSVNRRISRSGTIGVNYQHTHYDFPRAFGESDVNMYSGSWSTIFARSWTLGVTGGAYTSAVQGVQSTALDPVIAALLGIGSVQTIFYQENIMPMGSVSLQKKLRRASWNVNYGRTVNPGNGVYLTSRQETYGASYSYTGIRRLSLSSNVGVSKLGSLGLELRPYTQITGGANLSYNLGAGFNLSAGYARRHQDIRANSFQQDSSRISIGIYFSPGSVPVSFH